tara:strand:+ start:2329 stop:3774 length:1446 start_codon:yes stop_codon:yes gene_type:complete
MPAPTIKQPSKHFTPTLYEGNGTAIGSGGKTITGLEFQPDLVWIKNRDAADSHSLYDSSRGATKQIESDNTAAETTESEGLTSFTSDGFTLGNLDQVNTNNESFVGWNWKASGGSAPSQTYTVKVVSDSGNKYRFDDFGTSAVTLDLQEGGTYTFDLSDSSVDGHPMKFSDTNGGSHNGGYTYSTGVVYKLDGVTKTESEYVNTTNFNAATTRQIIITVAASAPTLYYFCHYHANMGGAINTNSTFGSSNFSGSIQSTVQTNSDAGFSIITFTGTNAEDTVGHGLAQSPAWVISRNLDDTPHWAVYHKDLSSYAKTLQLSNNNAEQSSSTMWDSKATTADVINVKNNFGTNGSSDRMVMYAWHPVDGFSRFGSYQGNASSTGDGTFVYTAFKPAWVMVKKRSGSGNWVIMDSTRSPTNPVATFFNADGDTEVDTASRQTDFLSNGFKLRGNNSATNASATYVYMAFAELPFFDGESPVTAR